MNLEKILLRFFPFCKRLPAFIPNPKGRYESLVVSGFYPGMLQSIKNSFSVVENYDYSQHPNTNFEVVHVGDFSIEKKTDKFIELIINKQRFIIHNGESNPIFTYYNKHAYLGSILFCALKHYYKDFTIQDDGIYLSKYDYVKSNSNTLILEEKVSGNFFDLVSLFELSAKSLVEGFHNKESYFDFLMESKYINIHSLFSLKNCDSEFLKEFYKYVESHTPKDVPNPVWSEEQIFYGFPKFRLNQFKKRYQTTLHFKTQINEKLDFKKVTEALKYIIKNKKESGIILAKYKTKRFKSKTDLETFVYASEQNKVLEDIASFASENINL